MDDIGKKFIWNEEKLKKLEKLAGGVSKIIERSEKSEIQEKYELQFNQK